MRRPSVRSITSLDAEDSLIHSLLVETITDAILVGSVKLVPRPNVAIEIFMIVNVGVIHVAIHCHIEIVTSSGNAMASGVVATNDVAVRGTRDSKMDAVLVVLGHTVFLMTWW